ncbi:MAG: hemolysin family protein [Blastocatellia bacterium]
MESELSLASILVLILVLVIVATAKSALDELSDVALRRLASESEGGIHAAFIRLIQQRYHIFSFTLTFGVHLSIALIAILITAIAQRIYADHFLLLSFLLMTVTLVLFRQVVPLLLTQNDPARMLMLLQWPLRVVYPALAVAAHPIYHALRGFQRPETPESAAEEEENAEEELQALIEVGEEEGIIEEDEGEMIQSVIRFGDRTVAEVMTPRTRMVAVAAGAPLEQVRDLMIESKYSRVPVYAGAQDDIEGVIYVRDLLTYWADGVAGQTASSLARPVNFVPETKETSILLREMQRDHVSMAIVIDEYGGLAGLVTMEDLIEEIVGEIEDEDEPLPTPAEADIVPDGEQQWIVRGDVEIGKLERLLDEELAADDFTTVAGFMLNQLGHLPAIGEQILYRGFCFEVATADERRISGVRVSRIAGLAEAAAEKPALAAASPRDENH